MNADGWKGEGPRISNGLRNAAGLNAVHEASTQAGHGGLGKLSDEALA
jgi:hypothetical protein